MESCTYFYPNFHSLQFLLENFFIMNTFNILILYLGLSESWRSRIYLSELNILILYLGLSKSWRSRIYLSELNILMMASRYLRRRNIKPRWTSRRPWLKKYRLCFLQFKIPFCYLIKSSLLVLPLLLHQPQQHLNSPQMSMKRVRRNLWVFAINTSNFFSWLRPCISLEHHPLV